VQFRSPGLVISAPRSGSGKTVITLGIIRALVRSGVRVQAYKCGPDYIDPTFHAAAARVARCVNLDSWAMRSETLAQLIQSAEPKAGLVVCEGVMGLFDGAAKHGASGTGATADIAALTGWPVILILDVSGQSQTAAAVAFGCARFRPDINVAGVILNRVASARHSRLIEGGLAKAGLPSLGALPRIENLALPTRHLGLVQAEEIPGIDGKIDEIAKVVSTHIDLGALQTLAKSSMGSSVVETGRPPLCPPGQRVAIASDEAFFFLYPHIVEGWRRTGSEIAFFSPLSNEAPSPSADAVWLPGGYPELHAGRLAGAHRFLEGLRSAAAIGKPIHGECGGYMVLGEALEDADGDWHGMAGLLGLKTSFRDRRLHLGYRQATTLCDSSLGRAGSVIRGHEFHYASVVANPDARLCAVEDAEGKSIDEAGSARGTVSGTFFHVIDRAE
jgi:cobyrinic acid a,c-diamide synthase